MNQTMQGVVVLGIGGVSMLVESAYQYVYENPIVAAVVTTGAAVLGVTVLLCRKHTYRITGTVLLASGAVVPNATVTLGGDRAEAQVTNPGTGAYAFADLPSGGNFTVQAAAAGHTFAPVDAHVDNLAADRTVDFTGTTFSIRGTVETNTGMNVPNATVSLGGVMVDASGGDFAFENLMPQGNYLVTATAPGYRINFADGRRFNPLGRDEQVAFVATALQFRISATVTSTRGPLGQVTLELQVPRGRSTVDITRNGDYRTRLLDHTGPYTLRLTARYHTPSQQEVRFDELPADVTHDFEVTRDQVTISGWLRYADGRAVPGGTMMLSGNAEAALELAGDGTFTTAALDAGGRYTVSPHAAHHTFDVESREWNPLTRNEAVQITATHTLFNIRGHVRYDGGATVPGVTVTLGGDEALDVNPGADGRYAFDGKLGGGAYTVSVAALYHTFVPAGAQPINGLRRHEHLPFVGTRNRHRIRGTVTNTGVDVHPVKRVPVTLAGHSAGATTTDANGVYEFTVDAGFDYTVTLGAARPHFVPAAPAVVHAFNAVAADQAGDFTGVRNDFDIIAQVQDEGGADLPGVTVTLSEEGAGNGLTAGGGDVRFAAQQGGKMYTLTPTMNGHVFFPISSTKRTLGQAWNAAFQRVAVRYAPRPYPTPARPFLSIDGGRVWLSEEMIRNIDGERDADHIVPLNILVYAANLAVVAQGAQNAQNAYDYNIEGTDHALRVVVASTGHDFVMITSFRVRNGRQDGLGTVPGY